MFNCYLDDMEMALLRLSLIFYWSLLLTVLFVKLSLSLNNVLLPSLNWCSFTLPLHICIGGSRIIISGLSGNWHAMRDAIQQSLLENF